MGSGSRAILTARLVAKAESLGVTGAGIASVAKLKNVPSYESGTTVVCPMTPSPCWCYACFTTPLPPNWIGGTTDQEEPRETAK